MDERQRSDDPIKNQHRVMEETIAKSESAPLRMVRAEIVMPHVLGSPQSKSSSKTK
jgi:hypothetical protein